MRYHQVAVKSHIRKSFVAKKKLLTLTLIYNLLLYDFVYVYLLIDGVLFLFIDNK